MGFEAYANVTRRKSENIKLTMSVSEYRDHIAVIILSAVLATTISTAPTLSQKVQALCAPGDTPCVSPDGNPICRYPPSTTNPLLITFLRVSNMMVMYDLLQILNVLLLRNIGVVYVEVFESIETLNSHKRMDHCQEGYQPLQE
jgi:hypothetical protein